MPAPTALNVLLSTNLGVAPGASYLSADANGNYFHNTGREMVIFKNSGAQITITIATYGKVNGISFAAQTVVLPTTTGERWIGPFIPFIYNDTGGNVQITYTAVSGVTAVVLQMPVLT